MTRQSTGTRVPPRRVPRPPQPYGGGERPAGLGTDTAPLRESIPLTSSTRIIEPANAPVEVTRPAVQSRRSDDSFEWPAVTDEIDLDAAVRAELEIDLQPEAFGRSDQFDWPTEERSPIDRSTSASKPTADHDPGLVGPGPGSSESSGRQTGTTILRDGPDLDPGVPGRLDVAERGSSLQLPPPATTGRHRRITDDAAGDDTLAGPLPITLDHFDPLPRRWPLSLLRTRIGKRSIAAFGAIVALAAGVVIVQSTIGDEDEQPFALQASAEVSPRLLGSGPPATTASEQNTTDDWTIVSSPADDLAYLRQQASRQVDTPETSQEPVDDGLVEPEIGPESSWVDSGNGVLVPDVLLRIRFCESTNNYQAANDGSSARGAYQFLSKSWDWYGHAATYGVAEAHLATPAQQDEAALATLQSEGTSPWAESRGCWADPGIDPRYAEAKPPAPPPTATTVAPTTTETTEAPESTTSEPPETTDTTEPESTTTIEDSTTEVPPTTEPSSTTTEASDTTSSSTDDSTSETTADEGSTTTDP